MTDRLPKEETVKALQRMIDAADSRGRYILDGMDARWLESAIVLINGPLPKSEAEK